MRAPSRRRYSMCRRATCSLTASTCKFWRSYGSCRKEFSLTFYSFQRSYWGIDITVITYGGTQLLGASSAIVDTGTTLIYIPRSAYGTFLKVANGTTDANSGLAHFVKKPTQSVTFTIGLMGYTLTPEQFLIPEAQ